MARATTKTTANSTPPTLPETPVLEGDELGRARAWFEDKVVREVRAAGHCSEALAVLDKVFGGPRPDALVYDTRGVYDDYRPGLHPAYIDSDGVDCWGNTWRDKDGYSREGFDKEGRDREGYDKHGRDKLGFDREGIDASGLHRDSPERYKYSADSYDAEGFNAGGFDRSGFNREGVHMNGSTRRDNAEYFGFDASGFNRRGYNAGGYDRDGEYSEDEYRRIRRAVRGER